MRRLLPLLLLVLFVAPPVWGRDLGAALADPGALRSVFFVRGMSCRACTMILDMRMNRTGGVFWARFNYPLRSLTVYHDPRKVSVDAIIGAVGKTGELGAVLLFSRSAVGSVAAGTVAVWKGGTLSLADANVGLAPFEPVLDREFGPDHPERVQVAYEIVGELVRNRLLAEAARGAGYAPDGPTGKLPLVIDKDFYWPETMRPLTPVEASFGRFVAERVMGGSEGNEGRGKFDDWLLDLWRADGLDFRGERLEIAPDET